MDYYERKEQKNVELMECWLYVLKLAFWGLAIYAIYELIKR